ncbi:MAG: YggT family protein [Proteobacteria bacterium]|jgi:YggT family protein|nr:YggT family protein [Pseudomonadota bacterium]MDA0954135.1 YggT family protein [Pseudomonadota bacterium]
MGALNDIAIYLLQTGLGFYLIIVMLRFIMQLVMADFYNPISQFVFKATQPLVGPLQTILKPIGRFDPASLTLATALQIAGIVLLLTLNNVTTPNPVTLFLWGFVGALGLLVKIYFYALLATIILSWISPGGSNPAAYLLHQITEPVMAPVRSLLPPMGGLDFSPIVVFILINIIEIALRNIAQSIGLFPALVIGL